MGTRKRLGIALVLVLGALLVMGFGPQTYTQVVTLDVGRNHVALRVDPQDDRFAVVFADVMDHIVKAYSYDGGNPVNPWSVYDRSLPAGTDTLTHVGGGLIIYVNAPCRVTVRGELRGRTVIHAGANLVGVSSFRRVYQAPAPVTKVFTGEGIRLRATDLVVPGRAYWVYSAAECEW